MRTVERISIEQADSGGFIVTLIRDCLTSEKHLCADAEAMRDRVVELATRDAEPGA